ncbi:MAG: hypothetical protein J6E38_03970 [Clostridia bacterium]|nr:hypothetical protein [Clostridia bacterium]
MADARNICEEIEIAIYSDAELSDEQKNHIENCESCKALLSQVMKMKKDLEGLSVPGLREGDVANAVMAEIAKQKTAVPFPKFRITHHIGTAAAVAVILVAALIIGNPSETDNFSKNDSDGTNTVVFDAPKTNQIIRGVTSDTNDEETVEESAAVLFDTEAHAQEEESLRAADIVMKKSTNGALQSQDDGSYFTDGAVTNDSFVYNTASLAEDVRQAIPEENKEAAKEEKPMMLFAAPPPGNTTNDLSSEVYEEEIIPESESEFTPPFDTTTTSEMQAVGGGSSGGAASSVCTDSMEASAESEQAYIFSGIELMNSPDSFSYNVSLLNERLYELYAGKYILSEEKLLSLGVDNAKLLELAPTITGNMFEFYKGILDIFE